MNPVTIPLNLQSVPLQERHNLPNCQSIYFVLEDGQVLYICYTRAMFAKQLRQYRLNSPSSD